MEGKYLTPKISDEINIMDRDVYLSDECIKYLITSYTYEAGVRKLKEKLYDIYRELNVRDINNKLGEIPAELGQCHELIYLEILENMIVSLPNSVLELSSLEPVSLNLSYNPISLDVLIKQGRKVKFGVEI